MDTLNMAWVVFVENWILKLMIDIGQKAMQLQPFKLFELLLANDGSGEIK